MPVQNLFRYIRFQSFANLTDSDHQPYFSRQQTAFAIEFQHRVFLADQILCSNKIKDVPLEYCQFYFRQLNIIEQLFIRIRLQNCNGFRLAIVIERDDDDFKLGWAIFTRKVLRLEYHSFALKSLVACKMGENISTVTAVLFEYRPEYSSVDHPGITQNWNTLHI